MIGVEALVTFFVQNRIARRQEKSSSCSFIVRIYLELTKGKKLKIRKNDVTLQWLHFVIASVCYGFTFPVYKVTWQCFLAFKLAEEKKN